MLSKGFEKAYSQYERLHEFEQRMHQDWKKISKELKPKNRIQTVEKAEWRKKKWKRMFWLRNEFDFSRTKEKIRIKWLQSPCRHWWMWRKKI